VTPAALWSQGLALQLFATAAQYCQPVTRRNTGTAYPEPHRASTTREKPCDLQPARWKLAACGDSEGGRAGRRKGGEITNQAQRDRQVNRCDGSSVVATASPGIAGSTDAIGRGNKYSLPHPQ
jgi:hypothetical protein